MLTSSARLLPTTYPKKRERTKTFTGCWTCRTRKLKCDEAQPECRQCSSKNIACAGYGARLHWLPCTTGEESSEPRRPKVRMGAGQRRMVVRDPMEARYTEDEIDRALQEIQQARPGQETFTKGPFHVFNPNASEERSNKNELPKDHEWSPLPDDDLSCLVWPEEEQALSQQTPLFTEPVGDSFPSSLGTTDDFSEFLAGSDSSPGLSDSHHSSPVLITPGLPAGGKRLELYQQSENLSNKDSMTERNDEYALTIPQPYRGLDDYPSEPRFMTSQNRLLLYHYVQNVVDWMAAISTSNSPWKAIHLPSSLQGSGELEATGHTANGRNALLHALLASSACNLATQFEFNKQDELAQQYRIIGQELFCKSVALIRNCMQEEIDGQKPKYKEILAAMLSMISIGVMAGETYATRLHLEGCESLMKVAKERTRKSWSSKARVLHRIYYYLRVMQESTAATCELNLKLQPMLLQAGLEHVGKVPQKTSLSMSLEQAADWLAIKKSDENDIVSFSCEFIYGVPQDLFVIVGRCTDLVQKINLWWADNPDSALPPDLASSCDTIEAQILDWPIQAALSTPCFRQATKETQSIMYHQTHAFHQATIIFFSQHIRPIHRYHLQPYVQAVLDHIVAIETIKRAEQILGGALLWPGFIAASEAVDESLQKRFLDWFDWVRSKGIGSSRAARRVLVEVWEGRRCEREEKERVRLGRVAKSGWRTVAEGKGINLMLT